MIDRHGRQVLDKEFAYSHILYELSNLDIGRHKDEGVALGKVKMIMKTMKFRQAIGSKWSAEIQDKPSGKIVHLAWSGVGPGDANQEADFEFDSLLKENAETIRDIALVSSC